MILGLSFGLLLPFTFAIGVLITFRVAGPVHRFYVYLAQVIRSEEVGPCRLRKGDDLQELCELINKATEPIRRQQTKSSPTDQSDSPRQDSTDDRSKFSPCRRAGCPSIDQGEHAFWESRSAREGRSLLVVS